MTTADNSPIPDYLARLRVDGRNFVVAGAGMGMGRQTSHALAQAYPSKPITMVVPFTPGTITDLVFRAPILHFAGRQARAGQATYAYEFAYPLPAPGRGAPHASDVPFIFGTTGAPHFARKIGSGPAVDLLSSAMMQAWGAFARDGNPGSAWPLFDAQRPQVMQFGPAHAAVGGLRGCDRLALWSAYTA
jgi:carboxylesterase type B